jgi:hypothetical protein
MPSRVYNKVKMEWNGMEWNWIKWNWMEWNGMEWLKNKGDSCLFRYKIIKVICLDTKIKVTSALVAYEGMY